MNVEIDVYNAAGEKVGDGPITTASNVSVKRSLDGIGTISFDVPMDDPQTALLTHLARFRVYVGQLDGSMREVGRGVVTKDSFTISSSGRDLKFSCPDDFQELKFISAGLRRKYDAMNSGAIANELASVAGWSCISEGDLTTTSARFDGASILKCLQDLAEDTGHHLRQGRDYRVLEFGRFGSDSGLTVVSPQQIAGSPQRDIAYITQLVAGSSSEKIATEILPLGAGEGEAALTLARSTRSSPYVIEARTAADGRIDYWLVDTAARAKYGVIQQVLTFKNITPIANTTAALIAAANALYDAAAAWLERNSEPQVSYGLTLVGCQILLRPGDKVRVVYVGDVYRDGKPYSRVNINDDFWILGITETPDNIRLDISNIDQIPEDDPVSEIVTTMESIELRNLKPVTYPAVFSYSLYDIIGFTHNKDVIATLPIDGTITDIIFVKMRITTFPLYNLVNWSYDGGIAALRSWFQVSKSNYYPAGLTISINGEDVTTALGGPFGSDTASVTLELDITPYITIDRDVHTFTIESQSQNTATNNSVEGGPAALVPTFTSNGAVSVQFTVFALIQAIL